MMGDYIQTIEFDGTEENHFAEITSDDVTIISSPGTHDVGCSKVTLKNIVDFNWEHKLYLGRVVAVHMLHKYIAYGIKAKTGGMVRIFNTDSTIRGIIKGFVGQPQDLAFANIESQILLACVDEAGNLFIHRIESPNIHCVLVLEIPSVSSSPMPHRVIWCPYIPESDGEVDEETAQLLVVTHGPRGIMMSINTIIEKYGDKPCADGGVISEGLLEFTEHSSPIMDAMFAPDGTALATASCDGEIKFFQVYMHSDVESTPRCLHQWTPHNGKAVSSLFFLDNHREHNPDVQYWKFAITGCDNNSELKLWSCQSWTCLQTITIRPHPNMKFTTPNNHLTLKANLDKSAQYLVLSDVYNRIMYIMQIIKNDDETQVFIKSVSEFLLPCCILSFDIVYAGLSDANNMNDLYDIDFDHNEEVDNAMATSPMSNTALNHRNRTQKGVTVRLYLVQPKSLQECFVTYHPQINYSTTVLKVPRRENASFKDDIADISVVSNHIDKSLSNNNDEIDKSSLKDIINIGPLKQSTPLQLVQPPPPPTHISLMTPDAFNSLKKDYAPSINSETKEDLKENSSVPGARISATPTIMDQKFIDDLMYLGTQRLEDVEPPMATSSDNLEYDKKHNDSNFASGGSSPSREVQEILSLKDSRSDLLDFELMDDGEIQEPASSTINVSQTGKSLASKPLNNTEVEVIDGGWPCPPKIGVETGLDDSITNCCTNGSSSNVFAPYKGLDNVIIDDKELLSSKSLEQFSSIIAQQTKELDGLRQEVKKLNEDQNVLRNLIIENSNNTARNDDLNLEKRIENAFTKMNAQQMQQLESLLDNKKSRETLDLNNAITQSLTQILDKQFIDKFSSNFTREIHNCIVPSVYSSMESLKQSVHMDLAKRLATTDTLLKEHIIKLVQNRHTIDLLSNALIAAGQTALSNIFKENLANSAIPSFERVTNQMFKQIHETFSQGIKDFSMNIDMALDKQRHQIEKSKDIIQHMEQLSENLQLQTEATNNINKNVYESISKIMKVMQDNLIKNLADNINLAFRKQSEELEDHLKSAVRSNSATPSPQVIDALSHQNKINTLLIQKDISGAFQHALMASDLSLVVYVCEKVNPAALFKHKPCPLPQNVLLSLIQQLSADLVNDADLKYRYLEEALLNLDVNDACTQEHLPKILRALKKQLINFIAQHPNNPITKGVRMLSMVTDSLLNTVQINNPDKKPNHGCL